MAAKSICGTQESPFGARGLLPSGGAWCREREIASALGFLPTHEAAFQVLRGLEVEVNDFLPYPLLRLAEEMFTRFQARNGEEELQFGMFRVAISTYSETAFREALANALIHRDYTQRRAVHVQWSEEQLEISSPGGFPSGIRLTRPTCP